VFDGPDAEPLSHAALARRPDELPELVLAWVPASALVRLRWSVDDLWSAIEDRGEPPHACEAHAAPGVGDPPAELASPAPASRGVLVWRRGLEVVHRTLDPDEAELAGWLVPGASFAELCGVLGALHGDAASGRAVELLVRWLAAGAIVERPAPADRTVDTHRA
jgi:hypothetical protein